MLQEPRTTLTSRADSSTLNATARIAGRGFSLLELVLVIVITTMIAGIAFPRLSASMNNARADQAIRRIESIVEKARAMARTRSQPVQVKFKVGIDRVVLVLANTNNQKTELNDSVYQVDITAADFNGDNCIVFDGLGMPDSGGTATIVVGSVTRTFTLSGPPSRDSTARASVTTRSTALDAIDTLSVSVGKTGP